MDSFLADPDGPPDYCVDRDGQVAALLLVAVAVAIRLSGTMEWWLNPDEGIYFSLVTQPTLASFWSEVSENAHPPLYYLILRGVGAFTTDFVWYRATSLLCGAAAVLALWACGREIAGRRPDRRALTGLAAAALLVTSPVAIDLSRVMRPYMLQLALVAGALALLLRYGRTPTRRTLGWYVALLTLALLTHYSSILVLGSLGGVGLYLLRTAEISASARRDLVLAHAAPALVVLGLYFFHLRGLAASSTADDALGGWLSFYLVRSPREAWLAFVGLQTMVGGRSLGGPVAVLTLAGFVVAAARREWLPVVVAGSALLVGLVAAVLGVYPMGSTRHSAWMLAFTLPLLAWLVGVVLVSGRKWAVVGVATLTVLVAARDVVGVAVAAPDSPWAASERVLRRADLVRMLDVLDPEGAPRLVVMDLQTYNMLLPFYFTEREEARSGQEDSFFHFRYGRRDMIVVRSWLLTVGENGEGDPGDLRSLGARVERFDPRLGLATAGQVEVLLGGWRAEVVDRLLALEDSGVVTNHRLVPGLFAFLVDMERLNAAEAR